MRSKFDEQLYLLNKELIRMGMLCEKAISQTVEALLTLDMDKARGLTELGEEMNSKDREIEDICLHILLQQQPVAKDLRLVSSALKMVTDMDRIGVQSVDIAEILTIGNIKRVDDRLPIREMSDSVIKMVTGSIDAFVKRDAQLAGKVVDDDDVVDGYFDRIKKLLIEELAADMEGAEAVLDMLMIAKYFERIGDHAVNIADWVIFSITGHHERID